ncbi:MAG: gamma-butyrobetaine hydroxylase-like domain-containing protein [Burkholderiaceae bacterium]
MRPQNILNDKQSGLLTVTWDDETQQQFNHAFLRSSCQCADCKKKSSGDAIGVTIRSDIKLTDLRPVGAYGIQLIFNDGHDRGIYPWAFLKSLTASVTKHKP